MPPTPNHALIPLLYQELRALAYRKLQGDRILTSLQPTELVHEAFLRLERANITSMQDRTDVLALAAVMMRRLLVDHARRRSSQKRGGGWARVELHDHLEVREEARMDLLALDQALTRLEELDPRAAEVVQLKFFGGLQESEIAAHLGVSERWVRKLWAHARAWLHGELAE
ncbi:sigma-70 family RNA polymerase sigma factor [bacterium]|nr:sigma-70 family RNA polymerase sigma factor [bacterium]HPF36248.1 ECF-type sigma factor [Candidatus Krumholzibacteria bacterium]HRX52017.1 ECF-type sigma factor [Candidatus Krumholzibacteria bacterium]